MKRVLLFTLMLVAPLWAAPLPPVDPGNALYIVEVESGVSHEDVVTSLDSAAVSRNFVSPAVFPIGEHLRQRGVPITGVLETRTYCSLGIGAEVLQEFPEFAAFAPCRIAIYSKDGKLYLALDRPTYAVRHIHAANDKVRAAAARIEATLIWMMDKARKGEI